MKQNRPCGPPVTRRWLPGGQGERKKTRPHCLPVVYSRPASCAAPYSEGEQEEEEEEAGHAKTDFVDGRVANQSTAVLSSIQLFTNL